MALIIKGDMPQGCWQGDVMNRTFCDWYDYCRGKCIPPKGFVPSDCPILGEIPDEHGMLVDEEDLRNRAYAIQRRDGISFPEALALALTYAPTVLEAST